MSFSSVADLVAQCRRTGILPMADETAHLSELELKEITKAWMEGMRNVADSAHRAAQQAFASRGWAFRWFIDWNPATKAEELLADALEAAIDVAEHHYPSITLSDLNDEASMGLLQTRGFGGAEGIQVKRDPYGTLLLISVHCFTGPANFVPGEGVEFEKGAKSHVFHLVYKQLPSMDTLLGDLAAYPLVTKDRNRDRSVRVSLWYGEGWTGPHCSRPSLHRPWNSITVNQALAA